MSTQKNLEEKYKVLLPHLDEKIARLYLASEAKSLGRGGKASSYSKFQNVLFN